MSDGTWTEKMQAALRTSAFDVAALADRTKIPRATVRFLLGEDVSVILPERVYLRGQVAAISRELGLDPAEAKATFDREHPEVARPEHLSGGRALSHRSLAVAATFGCIAIVAVVLAFVG